MFLYLNLKNSLIILLLLYSDGLKKQITSLRLLFGELIKYFTQCEDELNNTLVDELLKKTNDENDHDESSDLLKRVHLTPPNVNEIMNLIESHCLNDDADEFDLKTELNLCLEKLKLDANEILAISININENKKKLIVSNDDDLLLLSSIRRQLVNETQMKNDLNEQLNQMKIVVKSMELERMNLNNQLEQFIEKQNIIENDLCVAHGRIAELIESGHKEIVSEGYGEDGQKEMQGMS